MSEQLHPQPENPRHNATEAGAGPLGLPPPQLERNPSQIEARLTSQPRAVFRNCIVVDLMPSISQVEERLSEGRITEERARQEKESALARERMHTIGPRLADVQQMLRKGGLTAESEVHLKEEECALKEEWNNLWERA